MTTARKIFGGNSTTKGGTNGVAQSPAGGPVAGDLNQSTTHISKKFQHTDAGQSHSVHETRGAGRLISLPKMGRPSLTGLSIKLLGEAEYGRQYRALKRAPKPTS